MSIAEASSSQGHKRRSTKGTTKKDTELANMRDKLEASEASKKDLEDRFLRLVAEFDNFKKRTNRQFQELMRSANEDLILQLVEVVDNFERALEAAKTSDDFESFHQGVEMIYDHLQEVLKKQGVKEIEALGQKFNPNVHEALFQLEGGDLPEDMVVELVQKGYMLNDRLIRPAKVAVTKAKAAEGHMEEK